MKPHLVLHSKNPASFVLKNTSVAKTKKQKNYYDVRFVVKSVASL